MAKVGKKYHENDKVLIANPNVKRKSFIGLHGEVVEAKWLKRHWVYKYIVKFSSGVTGSFFSDELKPLTSRTYVREY